MPSALLIVAGLAGLLIGADLLVRGGAALASHLGVRPIVVGLTVVALGTSLPELAIGIDAVRQDSPGLAVGNIVGTNLVNILFILGLSALIPRWRRVHRRHRLDEPPGVDVGSRGLRVTFRANGPSRQARAPRPRTDCARRTRARARGR